MAGARFTKSTRDPNRGQFVWVTDPGVKHQGNGPRTRGVALWEDLVIANLPDGRVIGIKRDNGEIVWDKMVAVTNEFGNKEKFVTAPITAEDKVLIANGAGDAGTRGWIAALEARTGKELWRWYVVPKPGDPGSETWKDKNSAWKTGGGGIWQTGSYDPATRLTIGGTPSVTVRGNVTTSVTPAGGTKTVNYNVTGSPVNLNAHGTTTVVSTDDTVNYAVPKQLSTGSFSGSFTYDTGLQPIGATTPTSSLSIGYDSAGRVTSSDTYGAGSTAGYANATPTTPATATSTVNGVTTTTTFDGLGRPIKVANADGEVNTEYDSCGCSPLDKIKRVSLPHLASTPQNQWKWTTYKYDGIGRTTSVVGPDGSSTTAYLCQGDNVTVTDPAGAWKKFLTDVSGQLIQVNEPNPAGGADYITNYTYDREGHLTVSMPAPPSQERTLRHARSPTQTVCLQAPVIRKAEQRATAMTRPRRDSPAAPTLRTRQSAPHTIPTAA